MENECSIGAVTTRDLIKGSSLQALDAQLLVAHVMKKPRSWVLTHDHQIIDPQSCLEIQALFKRRTQGEPVAYITEEKEFYGRPFRVTRDTLIPRPATEALIDLTKEFLAGKTPPHCEIDASITGFVRRFKETSPTMIVDIGTGSGCIAVTLSLEGATQRIVGVDTSEPAIAVAESNVKNLDARNVTFVRGDGAEFIRNMREPFLLVSNPPYIPSDVKLEKNVVDFEPHEALFAGKKGTDVLIPLTEAAVGNSSCIGIIYELRTDQIAHVEAVCKRMGRS